MRWNAKTMLYENAIKKEVMLAAGVAWNSWCVAELEQKVSAASASTQVSLPFRLSLTATPSCLSSFSRAPGDSAVSGTQNPTPNNGDRFH